MDYREMRQLAPMELANEMKGKEDKMEERRRKEGVRRGLGGGQEAGIEGRAPAASLLGAWVSLGHIIP